MDDEAVALMDEAGFRRHSERGGIGAPRTVLTAAQIGRVGARLSTGLRVVGRRGYRPTRERLSVCLCIGMLGMNVRSRDRCIPMIKNLMSDRIWAASAGWPRAA